MNEKCFEPGTIQAFLDGETAPALSFEITNHAAKCDNCAVLIAQAEEENAQVFAMLDREMNTLVPSQRLWNSISVAIAEEKKQHSFWDRLRSGLLATFANPSITVAAGVLVVFAIFAAVWNMNSTDTGISVADDIPPTPVSGPSSMQPEVAQNPSAFEPPVTPPSSTDALKVRETNHSPAKLKKMITNADYRPAAERPTPQYAIEYLPGEESYVRTIADLKENVDSRKDVVMSPSTRVAFERDLAVVNDSIKKMKDVVRRNPKNQAARQVLYSSYQNKIDLLNSVVERGELMASMQ